MNPDSEILVLGHTGLVGSALVRQLEAAGYRRINTGYRDNRLDLRRADHADAVIRWNSPEVIFLAAAKVGGIAANAANPVDFLVDNLRIQTNVLTAAASYGVRKLVFLGSSCIYPKHATQPITEDALLSGPLEPTNDAYAIAKIAGIRLCRAYRQQHGLDYVSAMPTNLYGLGDNYRAGESHVIPALIRRFHEAKVAGQSEVVCWGTGTPRREIMFADDAARALIHIARFYSHSDPINVGVGYDYTIAEIAGMVASAVGYHGKIVWDDTKPDGTPRKLLDISKLESLPGGFTPFVMPYSGLEQTYRDFCTNPGVRK